MRTTLATLFAAILSLALPLVSQTPVVPPLIHFSNVATDEAGTPLAGVTKITFSLYAAQRGGEPLWTETQNVQLAPEGTYDVQLGATKKTGVPSSLFVTGQARWLGVQIGEQAEQPRVLLLSVPYALKAADAETIGGLPPSAFVLAVPGAAGSSPTEASTTSVSATVSGTGTANFLPLWLDGAGTLGNSVLFQSGTGATAKIGINTNTPATTLDVKGAATVRGILSLPATGVATATAGKASQPTNMIASAFNSGTSTAVNETFRWQAEPTGNNTATTSGSMNLLFGQGTAAPAETGFNVASNGLVHFAPGQTFPGTGAITAVTAGTDLTGGGSSGNITLNLDTTKVPQLAGDNLFAGNQTVAGIFKGATANFTGSDPNVLAQIAVGSIGVFGANNNPGISTGAGVEGTAAGSLSAGVAGIQLGGGVGVSGIATTSMGGIGVEGSATIGTAVSGTATDGNAASFLNGSSVNAAMVIQNVNSSGPVLSVLAGSTPAVEILHISPSALKVTTNNQNMTLGAVGCNSGFIGIQFGGTANCAAFSLLGNGVDTVISRASAGQISFREGNTEQMKIASGGAITINGNLTVKGSLAKGSGSFKIDHPLDPLNKYLYHSFVESPDMMNVYNGNVTTNNKGEAIVTLPDYFEALNRDFRYQVTVIGQFAQAIVAQKISHNRFVIRTNKPSVEVSWQITGIRQDAYANAHRIPVEEDKQGTERGTYLHPDAYSPHAQESPTVAEISRH